MNKDEKIANINIKIKDFFYKWMEFTKPFHLLQKKHYQVVSLLLYHHYLLKQQITNNKILWKSVFSYDTKVAISNELDIQIGSIENILTALRKKGVIKDNQITPYYIPNIDKKSKVFKLGFNFRLIHDGEK